MYINALFHNNLSRALALEYIVSFAKLFPTFWYKDKKTLKTIQLPQNFACQILMD
jgi:hypothetical protein